MADHVDSDTYGRLPSWQRWQVDIVAERVLALPGYVGSTSDARTDAVGIFLAARFAPPLGDNHHNAAACPYCTPKNDAGPQPSQTLIDRHETGLDRA